MQDVTIKINTPKDISNYKGQFVIFFSDKENPQVLFNSFIAEETYKKAEEIKKDSGKDPIVYRVQESDVNTAKRLFR